MKTLRPQSSWLHFSYSMRHVANAYCTRQHCSGDLRGPNQADHPATTRCDTLLFNDTLSYEDMTDQYAWCPWLGRDGSNRYHCRVLITSLLPLPLSYLKLVYTFFFKLS